MRRDKISNDESWKHYKITKPVNLYLRLVGKEIEIISDNPEYVEEKLMTDEKGRLLEEALDAASTADEYDKKSLDTIKKLGGL